MIKLDDQGEKEKRGGCSGHLDEDGDLIIAKRQERTTTEVITIGNYNINLHLPVLILFYHSN